MKGILFQVFETVVTKHHGAAAWDRLLTKSGLEGVYTSLGSYDDAEFNQLIAATAEDLAMPPQDIVRWLGREALPLLAEHYPKGLAAHTTTRGFVLTLNHIIHPEVRKMYPGAKAPLFEFDSSSPDWLVMRYRSARRMCAFAEGLILGAADHFRETAQLEHPLCMHRSDAFCELRIRFTPRQ